jgi:hydrogenase nickel incorporation protein HypA/HybF
MHELSVAMSIIDMAEEESAARGNAQISAVHVRLGRLSGVVKEALLSSYEMASVATKLEGSQLLIEEVPVEVFCPHCRERKALPSIQRLCCPTCGAPTAEVVQGRELEVVALEIRE